MAPLTFACAMVDGNSSLNVGGDDGGEDMYCFRCRDKENDLVTDVWVHVDVMWEEFAAKLARTFGRTVSLVYRREGEGPERKVQAEEEFEDLCEYLDDTQVS